jgi:hypothetical protein
VKNGATPRISRSWRRIRFSRSSARKPGPLVVGQDVDALIAVA